MSEVSIPDPSAQRKDPMTTTTTERPNPLLADWTTPYGLPPFGDITEADYRPAFEAALTAHDAEIAAVIADPAEPTFANTIEALETSGQRLRRISSVFFNLAGSHTNEDLQAIEREIAPTLTRHYNAIFMNEALFARVRRIVETQAGAGLTREPARVLERYHKAFVKSGAGLDEATKTRIAEISERLSSLGIQFGQNVLADEKSYALVLDGEGDLAGLPGFVRDAAARAAADRGLECKHVVTLSRSSIEPFLQFSARRDLRETAFKAWIARGETGGDTDNRAIIAEMVRLRAERARLQGHDSFAHFRLDDSMAGSPEAALELLTSVWKPARDRAQRERAALQALASAEGGNHEIAAWDWRYYAEKLRAADYDIDEGRLKPYLQLDKVIEAAFHTAGRLFGLTFAEKTGSGKTGVPVYHPDVRVWEVTGRDGGHVGLFLGDYFARPSKRSGAWMSAFRVQQKLDGDIRPIIVNVMNFSRASGDAPTLLSFDDARTVFHEFGHALHGLLSNVTYPMISGTAVTRDFVEFPSQLFEHWLERPEILQRFAVHHETGEPMPEDLLQRMMAARNFNQGFATVEYVSSALVDMKLHMLDTAEDLDATRFEEAALAEIGMPEAIVMRHRPTHFAHIFSGDGYSAAYYSYLWSEVLDADGFDAFLEAGDPFHPDTAQRLHEHVYSAGNSADPNDAYRAFRGRAATPEALLKKRGLVEP